MSAMVKRAEKLDAEHQAAKRRARNHAPKSFTSLQSINDCNSVVHGNVQHMDKVLGQAVEEFKLRWDRTKDWKDGAHLGVNLNRNRHQNAENRRRTRLFN